MKAIISSSKSMKKEIWETQAILYAILGLLLRLSNLHLVGNIVIGYAIAVWIFGMFGIRLAPQGKEGNE